MTATDTPTLPLESFPPRPPRPPRPLRTPAEAASSRRIVRRCLVAVVIVLALLVALVRIGVQVTGLWSPAPDTSAFDDVVRDSGLHESWRTEQSGSPAFGHPASVSVTIDTTPVGGQACVPLYRAAAGAGWTSTNRVDAASCAVPSDDGFPSRYDTLTGPDGERIELSWDPTYGTVWVDVEEALDGA